MISGSASSSSIVAGVTWIEHALLGTAATAIAVICIAGVGFTFLAGHIPVRRLATVIIGCFILFGASDIAAGLSALATRGYSSDQIDREPPPPVFTVPPRTTLKTAPDPFDPYAGASVPPGQ